MNNSASLKSQCGLELPLKSIAIHSKLTGVLSQVLVEQQFCNDSASNLEVGYSFPLPLDAVIFDLEVELNGETLKGIIKANSEAEEDYEEAIEEGNSAFLLTKVSAGFFNLNLGNVLASEQVIIRIKYAQLLQWQGEKINFYFPATFTPKYGRVEGTNFQQHQVPSHSLFAEYDFKFCIQVQGELAKSDIVSTTHEIVACGQNATDQCVSFEFAHFEQLNKDIIVSIYKPYGYVGEAFSVDDLDGKVHLASLCPPSMTDISAKPKSLHLMLDCSGSMMGESIEQAKHALIQTVISLSKNDQFNVLAFGTDTQSLFGELVLARDNNIDLALSWINSLDANMGGTETQLALEKSYLLCNKQTDILLLTDGAIWQEDEVLLAASKSKIRHFTIGVGNGANLAFLVRLSRATSASSELIEPHGRMARQITQHLNRIDQPKLDSVDIDWNVSTNHIEKLQLERVFMGDTSNIFCWSDGDLDEILDYSYQINGNDINRTIPVKHGKGDEAEALRSIAAYERLQFIDDKQQSIELAEKYQLVTEHTSCVLVHEREIKTGKIPEFIDVKHQIPQGRLGSNSLPTMYCISSPELDFGFGRKRSRSTTAISDAFSKVKGLFTSHSSKNEFEKSTFESDQSLTPIRTSESMHEVDALADDRAEAVLESTGESWEGMKVYSSSHISDIDVDVGTKNDLDYLDIPAFLRKQADEPVSNSEKLEANIREVSTEFSSSKTRTQIEPESLRKERGSFSEWITALSNCKKAQFALIGLKYNYEYFDYIEVIENLINDGFNETKTVLAWLLIRNEYVDMHLGTKQQLFLDTKAVELEITDYLKQQISSAIQRHINKKVA
ncbi:MAG: VWA domain-containing protein [Shewanella sp.]|nr:VWA domain-containing protein [Shewanella sp.]